MCVIFESHYGAQPLLEWAINKDLMQSVSPRSADPGMNEYLAHLYCMTECALAASEAATLFRGSTIATRLVSGLLHMHVRAIRWHLSLPLLMHGTGQGAPAGGHRSGRPNDGCGGAPLRGEFLFFLFPIS